MENKIICSGFGGQGVISLGQIISSLALRTGKNVTWFPAYGAEMRGGTANCHIVFSDNEVGSPIVTEKISTLIAMNNPSINKFLKLMTDGGLLIVNSSVVNEFKFSDNVNVYSVDATNIAAEIGNPKFQNMVVLGAYIATQKEFTLDDAKEVIKEKFSGSKEKFIEPNIIALEKGYNLVTKL